MKSFNDGNQIFEELLNQAMADSIGKNLEVVPLTENHNYKSWFIPIPQCQETKCGVIWQVKDPIWDFTLKPSTKKLVVSLL